MDFLSKGHPLCLDPFIRCPCQQSLVTSRRNWFSPYNPMYFNQYRFVEVVHRGTDVARNKVQELSDFGHKRAPGMSMGRCSSLGACGRRVG